VIGNPHGVQPEAFGPIGPLEDVVWIGRASSGQLCYDGQTPCQEPRRQRTQDADVPPRPARVSASVSCSSSCFIGSMRCSVQPLALE
jgi:hypothetical protein